jgi:hypothetical protein
MGMFDNDEIRNVVPSSDELVEQVPGVLTRETWEDHKERVGLNALAEKLSGSDKDLTVEQHVQMSEGALTRAEEQFNLAIEDGVEHYQAATLLTQIADIHARLAQVKQSM